MNGKRYKKGHKSLRGEEPFKGVESENVWVVISLVEEQWRRDAFIVSE